MINKNRLGWFMRWWYSHLLFPAQYVSFKDAGEEELFWNIVTWYHFFNHHKDFVCKIDWWVLEDNSTCIYIVSLIDWSFKEVYFHDKPCPIIQVTDALTTYKQEDGKIYKITGDSSVE